MNVEIFMKKLNENGKLVFECDNTHFIFRKIKGELNICEIWTNNIRSDVVITPIYLGVFMFDQVTFDPFNCIIKFSHLGRGIFNWNYRLFQEVIA